MFSLAAIIFLSRGLLREVKVQQNGQAQGTVLSVCADCTGRQPQRPQGHNMRIEHIITDHDIIFARHHSRRVQVNGKSVAMTMQ